MKKIYKLIIVPHTPRDTTYGPKETLAFCVKMIVSINEGSAVDVFHFDFSNAFDPVKKSLFDTKASMILLLTIVSL